MLRYPLHDLSDSEFEKLVGLICRELLGPAVTSFAAGKDGGKDAKFTGTAQAFPSAVNPAIGKFIVQAKHTSSPVGSCSDYDFETKTLNDELPKVKRMLDGGELTHYILPTNYKAMMVKPLRGVGLERSQVWRPHLGVGGAAVRVSEG